MSQNHIQLRNWINKFWCIQWKRKTVAIRTEIKEISKICHHHKQIYLIRCAMLQSKCADPFKMHKKPRKGMNKLIQTFISIFSYFTWRNFTVEIKLFTVVISILLDNFAKLLFGKYQFFLCVTGRLVPILNFYISNLN